MFSLVFVQRVSAFWKIAVLWLTSWPIQKKLGIKGFLASRTKRKRLGTDALGRFGENTDGGYTCI